MVETTFELPRAGKVSSINLNSLNNREKKPKLSKNISYKKYPIEKVDEKILLSFLELGRSVVFKLSFDLTV